MIKHIKIDGIALDKSIIDLINKELKESREKQEELKDCEIIEHSIKL